MTSAFIWAPQSVRSCKPCSPTETPRASLSGGPKSCWRRQTAAAPTRSCDARLRQSQLCGAGILGALNAVIVINADGASTVSLDLRGTFNLTVEVAGSVAERRRLRRHPVYQKPELLAEGPNQVSLSRM